MSQPCAWKPKRVNPGLSLRKDGSEFEKGWIAEPEGGDRGFILVGSENQIGWIAEPEKVNPGFNPQGVVQGFKKS